MSMELQIIRTPRPPEAYLGPIADLNREAGYPTTIGDLRRRIQELPEGDRLIMALDGESLIGYAHLRVIHDLFGEESVELVSIIVRKANRRQGVGRRLVAAAETWASQSGKARLLIRTEILRTEAHAFFVALGYDETSTSIDFIRDLSIARRAEAPTQPPEPLDQDLEAPL